MGFFAELTAWLDALLATYIADQTARIAEVIEPLLVTLSVLYLMIWGYMALAGHVDEPIVDALKRFFMVGFVFAVAIHLWMYNEVIVTSVFDAPTALAAVVVGAYEPNAIMDQVLQDGVDAGGRLIARGTLLDGFSFDIAGLAICLLVAMVTIYAAFLLCLSKIALSVLLAIGPLFLIAVLFKATRRFLEAWLAQLINYALVTVLTILVTALMLHVISTATAQALAAGGGITIAHAIKVCVTAGLTLLVMRQVLTIAAGLSHGLALASQSVVSVAMLWALGVGRRTVFQSSMDTSYVIRRGVGWTAKQAWQHSRGPNSIRDGGR